MMDGHRLRVSFAALLWVVAAACERHHVAVDVFPPSAGTFAMTQAGSSGSAGISGTETAGVGGAGGAAGAAGRGPAECQPEDWLFWAERLVENDCRVTIQDEFVRDQITAFLLEALPPSLAEMRTPEGCDLLKTLWFLDPLDPSQVVLCPRPCMFLAQGVAEEKERALQCASGR